MCVLFGFPSKQPKSMMPSKTDTPTWRHLGRLAATWEAERRGGGSAGGRQHAAGLDLQLAASGLQEHLEEVLWQNHFYVNLVMNVTTLQPLVW